MKRKEDGKKEKKKTTKTKTQEKKGGKHERETCSTAKNKPKQMAYLSPPLVIASVVSTERERERER